MQYIENGFEQRLNDKEELHNFALFLGKGLSTIKDIKAYNEFKFLHKYFKKIEDIIKPYSELKGIGNTIKIVNNVYSYNILSDNSTKIINKLYTELSKTPNPIIECDKQDFINAFTGKEIRNGIKWLVRGKNKQISKPSIMYFIDKLIDANLISTTILNDYNKYVKYVFRDFNGNELNNIKNSKFEYSKNPSSSKK